MNRETFNPNDYNLLKSSGLGQGARLTSGVLSPSIESMHKSKDISVDFNNLAGLPSGQKQQQNESQR